VCLWARLVADLPGVALGSPGCSVLTEPIGSFPRFPHNFGSQKVGTEERTIRFGSGSVLFRLTK
jgi:hypothetical protein